MKLPMLPFIVALFIAVAASSQLHAAEGADAKRKVLFLAGKPSHGYGAHDHLAGCRLLAKSLNDSGLPIESDSLPLRLAARCKGYSTASIASSCMATAAAGTWSTHIWTKWMRWRRKALASSACITRVEVPKGPAGEKFLDWIGGYFETDWSVNPHWTANFANLPDHPITRGVKPFEINDEWYYHMRFRDGMQGVTPILTALPPKESLSRPDGPPRPATRPLRAAIARGERQHMAWADGTRRWRPRLRLHRRPRPLELGRSEFPQARAQRDRLVCEGRRAARRRQRRAEDAGRHGIEPRRKTAGRFRPGSDPQEVQFAERLMAATVFPQTPSASIAARCLALCCQTARQANQLLPRRMISVVNVSRTYDDGTVQALTDVSLAIQQGEYLAIMGPSGSGKSTLLNLFGALDHPTSGDIIFQGQPINRLANLDQFRASTLGFVFQSFYLLPTLTALENVQIPMFESSLGPRQRVEKASELLALVGMSHRSKHLPTKLSVGERQRVAVARRWQMTPSCCWPTSPLAISIHLRERSCSTCSIAYIANVG